MPSQWKLAVKFAKHRSGQTSAILTDSPYKRLLQSKSLVATVRKRTRQRRNVRQDPNVELKLRLWHLRLSLNRSQSQNLEQRRQQLSLVMSLMMTMDSGRVFYVANHLRTVGTEKMDTVKSLVFDIQNSISISSSSARTFVSTGWRIKINIFVFTHSTTPTLRPSLRTFF